MRTVRLALVQLDSAFKDVPESIARADALISGLKPDEIDLMMLPETAFPGYAFDSVGDVEPYLETVDGPTTTWAKDTARRLRCHVIVGFPERGAAADGNVCAYNSTCIVSDEGTLLAVHRKRHMYPPADDLWVTPGSEWRILDLRIARDNRTKERRTVRCCPGICMDLNSDRFEAELDRFELTGFAADNGAEMMLMSMAWLVGEASEPPPMPDDEDAEWEQARSTLSYWAMRCRPLWERQAPAVFVACNRVGTELANTYTGSSAVLTNVGLDGPAVLAHAPKRGQMVLRAQVTLL